MVDGRSEGTAAVALRGATLQFGDRVLWENLDLTIQPGEFLAVLGPNGAGKTSLLKVLLGLQPLSGGAATVNGVRPHRGNRDIGYIPQQKGFDRDLPLRGVDLVRLGLDGHRYGWRLPSDARTRAVEDAIAAVGAGSFATAPVGALSGGEQQRLRVAQALVGEPRLLLGDEPLLSLDLRQQQAVTGLIDRHRRDRRAAVVLVTHEINPVLPLVDRVLYLVAGRWAVGRPEEVMTGERLSDLYGAPIDVLRVRDRIVVVGAPDAVHAGGEGHHHHGDEPEQRGSLRRR